MIWVILFLMAVSFTLSLVAPRPRQAHRRLRRSLMIVLALASLSCFVLAAVSIVALAFVMMFTIIGAAPALLWLDRFRPGDNDNQDDQEVDDPPPVDWAEFDRNRALWQRDLVRFECQSVALGG